MAIRTTIDIPDPLHDLLTERAKTLGTSIRMLIIRAIEDAYQPARKGPMITEPFVDIGQLGPEFPTDENPHELIFS